jgi:hypothetical protein
MKVRTHRLLLGAEKALVVLALLLFSRAFAPLFENGSATGARAQQLIYLVVFSIVAALIVLRLGRFVFVALSDSYTLLVVGYVVFSTVWSVAPGETISSLAVFLGATALGIYLAARYSLGEQVQLLIWMLVIGAVLSLFFGLFLEVGIERVGRNIGSWRGIYGQKNDLGRYMTLLIVLLWLAGSRKWIAWGAMTLAAALIFLSESATSILALGGMVLIIMLYRTLQWRNTRIVPVLMAGSALILSLFLLVVLANSTWCWSSLART